MPNQRRSINTSFESLPFCGVSIVFTNIRSFRKVHRQIFQFYIFIWFSFKRNLNNHLQIYDLIDLLGINDIMQVYQTLWIKQKVSVIYYFNKETDYVLQRDQPLTTIPNYKTFIRNLFCMLWTTLKLEGIASNFRLNSILVHAIRYFTWILCINSWYNGAIEKFLVMTNSFSIFSCKFFS